MAYQFTGASTDQYTEVACPHAIRVRVQVSNAAIAIQYGQGGNGRPGAAVYPPGDQQLIPSLADLQQYCDAIRFKSWVPGVPAQVSINAVPGNPYA